MNRAPTNPSTLLYLRYGAVIFSRCRQLLKDEQLAELATQEIFLRLRSRLQTPSTAQQALKWIYRSVNTYLLDIQETDWAVSRSGAFALPE